MSGSVSGRSTWCGENSKDEEDLKDPVEIMKRAREFLEKQHRIMLDPMTWTIPPPKSPQPPTSPPSSSPPTFIGTTPAVAPLLLVQPDGTEGKSQFLQLYSVALPNSGNAFLTPIAGNSPDPSNLKLLPFVGIVSPERAQGMQNIPTSIGQTNLLLSDQNSQLLLNNLPQQFSNRPQQLQNLANFATNGVFEAPRLLRIPPPPSPPKSFAEHQSPKLENSNDLTDLNSGRPIRLVLNRSVPTIPSPKDNQLVYS
uniref:Uncharacterized protein n=1 Tax=Setaria digitata TaxID=48799 RepID=A0A915PJN2_9BILA